MLFQSILKTLIAEDFSVFRLPFPVVLPVDLAGGAVQWLPPELLSWIGIPRGFELFTQSPREQYQISTIWAVHVCNHCKHFSVTLPWMTVYPNLLHMEAVAFTLFPEILTFHGSPFWSQALTTPGISSVCCMFMLSAIRMPLLTVFWTTELHKLSFSYLYHIQKSNSELEINCSAIWIQPKFSEKDTNLLACSTSWQMGKCCIMVREY